MLQRAGMKVADVMSTQVDYVTASTSVKDVSKLIFGRGINGVPVCKDKKLIGMVTEQDILDIFYPSIQEFVQDYVHASNFEAMEERVRENLNLPVSKVMNTNITTVKSDVPLLKAQSIMKLKQIGRLPVVDEKGNLIGIVAKGDIFRYLMGKNLPLEEDEQFHDWLSKRYDLIFDQKARFSKEIPDLVDMFRKLKVKTVLDVGCGTGGHSIALAHEGFEVVGIDRSSRMINVAKEKIKSLPKATAQHIKFISTDYKSLDTLLGKKFDAAIFMGSALAHVESPSQVLEEISKVLSDRAVIICQIVNYNKVIKVNKRIFDVNVGKSPYPEEVEQAFLRFYDEKEGGFLTQNLGVFVKGPGKWSFKGIRSMQVYPLTKEKVTTFLKKVKFLNIKYFGGEKGFFYDHLFSKPFNPIKSDALTVVARR